MTRIAAAVTWFALLAYVLAIRGTCRLFPWDSPDFYALYTLPNTYWGQPMVIRFADRVVLGAVGLVGLAGIVRPQLMWPSSLATLGLTFAIGWLGVLDWQRETSRNHATRLTETRSLAAGIGSQRIQAIGAGRFGPFAANLFGLTGNPLVTAREGNVIQASDLQPQAEAVFIEGQHEFRAPYAWKIGGRSGTMYALIDRGVFAVARGTGTLSDKPSTFTYRLGDSVKNVSLFGFNPPEPWGAWSAISPAEIVLPEWVAGRTRVTWQGFVPAEHADTDIVLRIGNARIVQRMTAKTATYVGECDVQEATNRVLVESTIFKPHPWSTSLGVGLTELTIEVLSDVP